MRVTMNPILKTRIRNEMHPTIIETTLYQMPYYVFHIPMTTIVDPCECVFFAAGFRGDFVAVVVGGGGGVIVIGSIVGSVDDAGFVGVVNDGSNV
mmetsp:Transcript_27883/g.52556  ORF Transcript_27883/g.52556 Transcript_27883/m.52556 type:complete len:95 (-) Transcript_27883:129-413(-)